MADSSISISNRALSFIGSKSYITALDESSAQARQCNIHYEPALKQTLEDFDWPFATTIQELSAYGTAPDQWAYQYMYPANCIKAQKMCFGTRVQDAIPFQIANIIDAGNNRRVIWTDLDSASLQFTVFFEDVPFMPPSFQEALAAQLAFKVALPLTRDKKLQISMAQFYGARLNHAEALLGNEGIEDVNERSASWHEARDSASGYNAADILNPDA